MTNKTEKEQLVGIIKKTLILHRKFYGDKATYYIEDEHIKYLSLNIESAILEWQLRSND